MEAETDGLTQGGVFLWACVEGILSVRVLKQSGATRPAQMTAGGKWLLGGQNQVVLDRWIEGRTLETYTPTGIGSIARLRAELAEIRRCGYAVDEQEFELGLACIAAPVHDATGRVVAAVAISGPSSRVDEHRILELALVVTCPADPLAHAFDVRSSSDRVED